MKDQATQRNFEGVIVKRWRVTLEDGTRVFTWADTRWRVKAKTFRVRGQRAVNIEPVQSYLSEAK